MKIGLLLLLLWATLGATCGGSIKGTSVRKTNMMVSIDSIVRAFDRSTMGLRLRGPNGREFFSRYSDPEGDGYEDAVLKPQRAYAKLTILNDRRPYTLVVQYIVERRDDQDSEYYIETYDDEQARRILRKMNEMLASGSAKEKLF